MSAMIRFGSVSLDCPNHRILAEFYARLLGVDILYDAENVSALRLGEAWLLTQQVDDYRSPTWPDPTSPQQLHLDFATNDLDAAEAAAIAAGARKAEFQPNPDGWRVMLDPVGHPFCLNSLIPE